MNINPHSLSFPAAAGASGERNTATTEGRAGEIPTSVIFDIADKISISVPGAEASEKNNNENKEKKRKESDTKGIAEEELSDTKNREVEELKKRDKEVKQHEAAHLAAAGRFATSPPHYEWERGPDGEKYAVGGEVGIDTSKVKGDPEATIKKMEQVERAAMAPASPSSRDYQVAAKAKNIANKAHSAIEKQKREENENNISTPEKAAPARPETLPPKANQQVTYYTQIPDVPQSSLSIAA